MKRTLKISLFAALAVTFLATAALFVGCEGEIPAQQEQQKTWQVGGSQTSPVVATLTGSADSYTLEVLGNGALNDFAAATDAPWYEYRKQIASISIGEGVTRIGNKAFLGITVDKAILPSTVTYVGEFSFAEDVELYALNAQIDCQTDNALYLYSARSPETHDVFWQSDYETEDITTRIVSEGDAMQNLFYMSGGAPKLWGNKIKVLFIGNSFTYRNGIIDHSSGVPGIFDQVAYDLGYYVETYSITGPGWYLDAHANKNDKCGKQVDLLLNAVTDFDYIVLQEQSVTPFENYTRFLNGVTQLKTKIENTQRKAKIYLYETWGSPYSANERNITVPAMEQKLRDAYTNAGAALGLNVTYVGKAFTDVYVNHPEINLYATDNRHQGYPGAYASACTHVANMLGGDVRETTFEGEAKYSAPTLPAATYNVLRKAAYNSAHDIESDDIPGEVEQKEEHYLVIGWWNYSKSGLSETLINCFVADLKTYLGENGASQSDLNDVVVRGYTDSLVADVGLRVKADADVDVLLGMGNNVDKAVSEGGATANIPCVERTPADALLTMGGKSGRVIARLTDTAAAKTAYDWMCANAANIAATTYVNGQQEPDGPSEKDQTKILKVACWGRFMTETKFNELIEGYRAYCTANNIEYDEIIATYYKGAVNGTDPYFSISAFSAQVKADGDCDICLPCGTNWITDQENVSCTELIEITVYGKSNRRLAPANNDELTYTFVAYIATDEAKAILEKAD